MYLPSIHILQNQSKSVGLYSLNYTIIITAVQTENYLCYFLKQNNRIGSLKELPVNDV